MLTIKNWSDKAQSLLDRYEINNAFVRVAIEYRNHSHFFYPTFIYSWYYSSGSEICENEDWKLALQQLRLSLHAKGFKKINKTK